MRSLASAQPFAVNAETAGSPGEQWVHLMPSGSFAGRDGRGPWKLDDPAGVIQATRERAGKTQLPIDYDHQSDFAATPKVGGTAPAAGWIKGLQARNNGIWGLVSWTERASTQLSAREYRYISPVFTYDPQTGAVKCIVRAGLTNNPNLDLTAVASAGDIMDDELKDLRDLLGLADDANIGEITNAVRNLVTAQQSAAPDPARYVPMGEFERVTTELHKLNKGVSVQTAQSAVNDQIERGRLPPFLRQWGIELCSVNKPAFDAFINRTSPALAQLFQEKVPGVYRGEGQDSVNSSEGAEVFKNLGLSAEDLRKFGKGN